MNSTSRYALLAAFGLAIAAVTPVAPVFAKKDEAPKQKPFTIGPEVAKHAKALDAASAKKDLAAWEAEIAATRAVAKTPDEKFYVSQQAIGAAQLSQDQGKLAAAIDESITTGEAANRLEGPQRAQLYFYRGQFAYVAKDYAKAAQSMSAAIQAGTAEENAPVLLADSMSRTGQPAEGLATLQKAIDAKTAAGQPVPATWFEVGSNIAAVSGAVDPFIKISAGWLASKPSKAAWANILNNYRAIGKLPSGGPNTDLLRLARATGALPLMTKREYIEYYEGVYRAYPGEADAVIKEGVAAGKLNLATDGGAREVSQLSQGKIAADKASLPAAATAANGPKASFQSVMATADVFYGYKDFAKAAELYKVALTKPNADASVANLHLGAALAQSGDKAGALAAFNNVTAKPHADIATFWKVWVEHPAAS